MVQLLRNYKTQSGMEDLDTDPHPNIVSQTTPPTLQRPYLYTGLTRHWSLIGLNAWPWRQVICFYSGPIIAPAFHNIACTSPSFASAPSVWATPGFGSWTWDDQGNSQWIRIPNGRVSVCQNVSLWKVKKRAFPAEFQSLLSKYWIELN